jgi:hypothetical protein
LKGRRNVDGGQQFTDESETVMSSTALTTALRTGLALSLAGAGSAKVTKQQSMLDSAKHLDYSTNAYRVIGAAELAGAAGLLAAPRFRFVGIAANLGAVGVLTGAVIEHLRAGDGPDVYAPAAVLDALAVLTLVRQLGDGN